MDTPMKKYILQYTLPYIHIVQIGITAPDSETAIEKAQELFNGGTLWDDTSETPLLYDDFEEDGTADAILEFTVEDVLPDTAPWPETAACVKNIRQREAAFAATNLLISAYIRGEKNGGSIAWEDIDAAYEKALETR